jgi:hypothetical protein
MRAKLSIESLSIPPAKKVSGTNREKGSAKETDTGRSVKGHIFFARNERIH